MMENKRSVTTNQLILLLDELEIDPTLSHERMLDIASYAHDVKWEELVNRLNAVPNGAKRTVPRWKQTLINWKLAIQRQSSTDSAESLDELGKRLHRLVEEENVSPGVDKELGNENENENQNVFRRPQLKMNTRRRSRLTLAQRLRQPLSDRRRMEKSLTTIYDINQDRDSEPTKKIMEMQLEKMHEVSERLENHIQDVQNRIQAIKDLWQHECVDDDL